MTTTELTYTREARARASAILAALAKAGLLPDEQTIAGLRCLAAELETELAGELSLELIRGLSGVTSDAEGLCIECRKPLAEHFDARRRWVGHR